MTNTHLGYGISSKSPRHLQQDPLNWTLNTWVFHSSSNLLRPSVGKVPIQCLMEKGQKLHQKVGYLRQSRTPSHHHLLNSTHRESLDLFLNHSFLISTFQFSTKNIIILKKIWNLYWDSDYFSSFYICFHFCYGWQTRYMEFGAFGRMADELGAPAGGDGMIPMESWLSAGGGCCG